MLPLNPNSPDLITLVTLTSFIYSHIHLFIHSLICSLTHSLNHSLYIFVNHVHCQSTMSANMRALARLADHQLMKKAVDDFRQKHGDWQDLTAFLLIKQTGRKFKTKKQKQKKLTRRVENINASETMTKAYIGERFGQEGLQKAELRFLKKQKRRNEQINESKVDDGDNETSMKFDSDNVNAVSEHEHDSDDIAKTNIEDISPSLNSPRNCEKTNIEEQDKIEYDFKKIDEIAQKEGECNDDDVEENDDDDDDEQEDMEREEDEEENVTVKVEEKKNIDTSIKNQLDHAFDKQKIILKDIESRVQQSSNSDEGTSSEEEESMESSSDDSDCTDSDESSDAKQRSKEKWKILSRPKSKNDECVVKEFKFEESSDDNDDNGSDEEEEDKEEEEETSEDDTEDEDDNDDDAEDFIANHPKKEMRSINNKSVPDFLTQKTDTLKNMPKDPFFVGSDEEEVEETFEEEDDNDYGINNERDFNRHEGYFNDSSSSSKKLTESMFYDPNEKSKSRGRFEKKDFSTRFNVRARGRGGFEGHGRSLGGSSSRGRGGFDKRGGGGFKGRDRGEEPPAIFRKGKKIEPREFGTSANRLGFGSGEDSIFNFDNRHSSRGGNRGSFSSSSSLSSRGSFNRDRGSRQFEDGGRGERQFGHPSQSSQR